MTLVNTFEIKIYLCSCNNLTVEQRVAIGKYGASQMDNLK